MVILMVERWILCGRKKSAWATEDDVEKTSERTY